jgi:hypothetical protein
VHGAGGAVLSALDLIGIKGLCGLDVFLVSLCKLTYGRIVRWER